MQKNFVEQKVSPPPSIFLPHKMLLPASWNNENLRDDKHEKCHVPLPVQFFPEQKKELQFLWLLRLPFRKGSPQLFSLEKSSSGAAHIAVISILSSSSSRTICAFTIWLSHMRGRLFLPSPFLWTEFLPFEFSEKILSWSNGTLRTYK